VHRALSFAIISNAVTLVSRRSVITSAWMRTVCVVAESMKLLAMLLRTMKSSLVSMSSVGGASRRWPHFLARQWERTSSSHMGKTSLPLSRDNSAVTNLGFVAAMVVTEVRVGDGSVWWLTEWTEAADNGRN
jgi:hypothetical protein